MSIQFVRSHSHSQMQTNKYRRTVQIRTTKSQFSLFDDDYDDGQQANLHN